jgi:GxxExxY protein
VNRENEIAAQVVDAAVRIHKELGPGLLESVYEAVLAHELSARGLRVARQVSIPIRFEGLTFDEGFRADLLVENLVIVELKSVQALSDVHRKQTLTYVRLARLRLGLLLNFGGALMKDGIVRIAHGLPEDA